MIRLSRTLPLLLGAVLALGGCDGNLNDGSFPLNTTDRVSLTSSGGESNGNSNQSSISADGRYIVFTSIASNLVPGDDGLFSDVYLRDFNPSNPFSSTTIRVSVSTTGGNPNGASSTALISADGNYVVFFSAATNLVAGDTNAFGAVYRWNRLTGVIDRVTLDSGGNDTNASCSIPSVSEDGRFVAFQSQASDLEGAAGTTLINIFRRDMSMAATTAGATRRVSLAFGGGEPSSSSFQPSISGDGRFVAFASTASDFVSPAEGGFNQDIYVWDANAGITRVSNDFTGTGELASGSCNTPAISRDSNWVVFDSDSPNLLPVGVDTNGARDVFKVARTGGVSTRVSVNNAGSQALNAPVQGSLLASVSGDGRFVVFQSDATNLFSGDVNGTVDIVIRDTLLLQTFAGSLKTGGAHTEVGGNSTQGRISADGRYVSFHSNSIELAGNDNNSATDVFRRGKLPQ